MYSNCIYHHGVKGMKWGVRKDEQKVKVSRKKKSKPDDSEAIALRNKKIKTILAVSAGVTAVAATAYLAKKYHLNFAEDKVIPPSTVLQNMNVADKMDLNKSLYVSYKNADKKKYFGLYGNQLSNISNNAIKKTTVSVGNSGLKVVSHKNAKDIFAKTFSNKEDMKILKDFVNSPRLAGDQRYAILADKAKRSINKGQIDNNVYKLFNVQANYDKKAKALQDKFFKTLKEKGYGGIEDLNDRLYSGYKSKNPLIVFGGDKVLDIQSSKTVDVGRDVIQKQFLKEFGKLQVNNLKTPALAVGGLGAAASISNIQAEKNYVKAYRQEHPNSKLSFEKILETKYD